MTVTETDVTEGVVVDDESDLQRAIDEATLDGTKPTEMVHIESRSGKGFLTIDPQQTEWTETQLVGLKSIGIQTEGPDAVPLPHVLQFLYICQMKDLDPWLREAYLIVHGKINVSNGTRYDNRKFTLVTGIDGFRKRSEDTGLYLGQVGPEWCGEDGIWKDFWIPKWGHPEMARVGILRKGSPLPTWGVAAYDEYVPMVDEYSGYGNQRQKTGRKVPTEMWQKMAVNQTAKCAEAQAHRKAFPRQMSGLLEPAEMERAEVEYQQENEAERQRALATKRHEARAQSESAPAGGAVIAGEVIPNAHTGDPVSVGESARETVEQMRAQTRAPRGESRAPASALGAAGARVEAPDAEQAAHLRAEIEMLAGVFGRTPGELLSRQASALGKEPKEFTVDELRASVMPLRAPGAAKMRASGRGSEAAAYETVPSGAVMPLDVLLGTRAEVDPAEPHGYVDAGGVCKHCGREQGETIHPN